MAQVSKTILNKLIVSYGKNNGIKFLSEIFFCEQLNTVLFFNFGGIGPGRGGGDGARARLDQAAALARVKTSSKQIHVVCVCV